MSSFLALAQYIGPVLAAVYLVVSGLAALFTALGHIPGGFGVFCTKAASALGVVALDVNKLLTWVKTLFGKAPAVATLMLALYLCVAFVACTPMAAVVPVTPDNQAQVASCQSLSQAHNALIIGDFSLGVLDTSAAGIAAGLASSNPTASKDIGIGTTAGAAIVAGGLVLANMYANQYAASQCAAVLGPLPVLPAKPKPAGDGGAGDAGYSVTMAVSAGGQ